MRIVFENELKSIRAGLAAMSTQAISATSRAVTALVQRNYDEAREVKREDKVTDQLRYQVENECLLAMATQQPMARDARELLAATIVAVELERCADYAKGVAKAARRITKSDSRIETHNLPDMDRLSRDMLERSTQAFFNSDVAAANQVLADDEKLDGLYNELLKQTMVDMSDHPTHIESDTWLLHAGHCLERIGDRATNIAERVIFVVTGDNPGDLNVHDAGRTRALG